MSERETDLLLEDILDALTKIEIYTKDYSFEDYVNDSKTKDAVERNFEIIGEAVSKLLKINPEINISYARQIVDLRNKVIHAYDNVNNIIIWKVVTKDLPVLLSEVKNSLKENHD